MRLNLDCIRDILLLVENETGYRKMLNFSVQKNYGLLDKYTIDEIFYHFDQCNAYGYFTSYSKTLDAHPNIAIVDLTPRGHEFVENIRSETIWKKIKETSGKIGSGALKIIESIASGVATALINRHLGL